MAQNLDLSDFLTPKLISILEYKNIRIIKREDLLFLIKKYTNSKNPNKLIKNLKYQKKLLTIKREYYLYVPVASIDKTPSISEFEINEVYLDFNDLYYIGLINAYHLHGFTTQIPNKLFVFNTKYNLEKKIFNFKIKYIKIPKDKFFGIYSKKYPFSDIEKTIIDVLNYFKYVDSLDTIINQIKKKKHLFNENKLINYAKKEGSVKILKLIGVITDNQKLFLYLKNNNKLNYYTKIRNTKLNKRYNKWKIALI